MSQVTILGRSLRMLPLSYAGDRLGVLWSVNTTGSYMSSGGHVGITNHINANETMYIWVGPILAWEFAGSVGTHENPSVADVANLNLPERTDPTAVLELSQDPYGRYATMVDGRLVSHDDGVQWTAGQQTYARDFIREFGIAIPNGGLYEPLVAPTNTIYIVSGSDNQDVKGNFLT